LFHATGIGYEIPQPLADILSLYSEPVSSTKCRQSIIEVIIALKRYFILLLDSETDSCTLLTDFLRLKIRIWQPKSAMNTMINAQLSIMEKGIRELIATVGTVPPFSGFTALFFADWKDLHPVIINTCPISSHLSNKRIVGI
jgi:hypothetical protein